MYIKLEYQIIRGCLYNQIVSWYHFLQELLVDSNRTFLPDRPDVPFGILRKTFNLGYSSWIEFLKIWTVSRISVKSSSFPVISEMIFRNRPLASSLINYVTFMSHKIDQKSIPKFIKRKSFSLFPNLLK